MAPIIGFSKRGGNANLDCAEDDFVGRKVMHRLLLEHGECDVAVDGVEAIKAFDLAWRAGTPYDVMFLDIMMPNMSGHEALKIIRDKRNGSVACPRPGK